MWLFYSCAAAHHGHSQRRVPFSLVGTFACSICSATPDNLSLMALTIATGFVVDDAIVVIENITRYLEEGMEPWRRR